MLGSRFLHQSAVRIQVCFSLHVAAVVHLSSQPVVIVVHARVGKCRDLLDVRSRVMELVLQSGEVSVLEKVVSAVMGK